MMGRFDAAPSVSCVWEHAECFNPLPVLPVQSELLQPGGGHESTPDIFQSSYAFNLFRQSSQKRAGPSGVTGPGSLGRSPPLRERQTGPADPGSASPPTATRK